MGSPLCSSNHHEKTRNLKGDLGKSVQMYRALFLDLPGAPNSQNPPVATDAKTQKIDPDQNFD